MSRPEDTTVLIVEDDDDLREVLALGVADEGYQVIQATSGNKALALINEDDAKKIGIILSDVRMPDGDGPSLLKSLRAKDPKSPEFIFLTGYADIGNDAAVKLGARRLFNKPFHLSEVISELDAVISYERK